MRLKSKKHLPFRSSDDSEEWIVSYADMVTLLMCFFILFFNEQSRTDNSSILRQIAAVFSSDGKLPTNGIDSETSEFGAREKARVLSQIESDLRSGLGDMDIDSIEYGIERKRKELVIRVWNSGMFPSGRWNMSQSGRNLLLEVGKALSGFQKNVDIVVEGHTDSVPVVGAKVYENNLTLSGLRAMTAANVLIEQGIEEKHLSAKGLGASQLLIADRDEQGNYLQDKTNSNRRLELRVIPRDIAAQQMRKEKDK